MMAFTDQQIKDWKRYENARCRGFNIWGACADTRLPDDRFWFVIDNYTELKAAVEREEEK